MKISLSCCLERDEEQQKKNIKRKANLNLPATKDISLSNSGASGSSLPKTNSPTILKLVPQLLLDESHQGFTSGNIVCSPLSLEFILHMVAMGSKGETLDQLLHFIGSSGLEDLNLKSSRIMSMAFQDSTANEKGPTVSFANGVWVDERFKLKQSYQLIMNDTYKAQVENVDFLNKAEEVVARVNSWAEKETKGLIKQVLPLSSLSSESRLVLANALYFKGAWARSFLASSTREKNFYLLGGEMVSVPFMTGSLNLRYGSFDSFKVLKVPYRCGEGSNSVFSMSFFLPHQRDGLPKLLEKFNSDPDLLREDFELRWEVLAPWIPKFKFEYKLSDASGIMKSLGLTLPFNRKCEDFTEMVHIPRGHENIYISEIIQKAVIEIDEEGAKAAAVTCSGFEGEGCAMICGPSFVADHPFMFSIMEEKTKEVFFAGVVVDPRQMI